MDISLVRWAPKKGVPGFSLCPLGIVAGLPPSLPLLFRLAHVKTPLNKGDKEGGCQIDLSRSGFGPSSGKYSWHNKEGVEDIVASWKK